MFKIRKTEKKWDNRLGIYLEAERHSLLLQENVWIQAIVTALNGIGSAKKSRIHKIDKRMYAGLQTAIAQTNKHIGTVDLSGTISHTCTYIYSAQPKQWKARIHINRLTIQHTTDAHTSTNQTAYSTPWTNAVVRIHFRLCEKLLKYLYWWN